MSREIQIVVGKKAKLMRFKVGFYQNPCGTRKQTLKMSWNVTQTMLEVNNEVTRGGIIHLL